MVSIPLALYQSFFFSTLASQSNAPLSSLVVSSSVAEPALSNLHLPSTLYPDESVIFPTPLSDKGGDVCLRCGGSQLCDVCGKTCILCAPFKGLDHLPYFKLEPQTGGDCPICGEKLQLHRLHHVQEEVLQVMQEEGLPNM